MMTDVTPCIQVKQVAFKPFTQRKRRMQAPTPNSSGEEEISPVEDDDIPGMLLDLIKANIYKN